MTCTQIPQCMELICQMNRHICSSAICLINCNTFSLALHISPLYSMPVGSNLLPYTHTAAASHLVTFPIDKTNLPTNTLTHSLTKCAKHVLQFVFYFQTVIRAVLLCMCMCVSVRLSVIITIAINIHFCWCVFIKHSICLSLNWSEQWLLLT